VTRTKKKYNGSQRIDFMEYRERYEGKGSFFSMKLSTFWFWVLVVFLSFGPRKTEKVLLEIRSVYK
jgi:hypothetical protein